MSKLQTLRCKEGIGQILYDLDPKVKINGLSGYSRWCTIDCSLIHFRTLLKHLDGPENERKAG